MAKRRAGRELTRDNWDDEEEPEESGTFQKASKDILQRRVIKTAKRRVPEMSSSATSETDSQSKSLFSGFTGFSTAGTNNSSSAKKSFSFLSDFGKSAATATTTAAADTNNRGDAKPSFFASLSAGGKCSSDKLENSSDSKNQSKLNELSAKLKKRNDDEKKTPNSKGDNFNGETEDKGPNEVFLQKLRSLNLLCAEWIIKHLNENLEYILTPVFDDYKRYLNQLKEERQNATTISVSNNKKTKVDESSVKSHSADETEKKAPTSGTSAVGATATAAAAFKAPDFKESLSKINFSNGFFFKSPDKTESKKLGNSLNAAVTDNESLFEFGKAKSETGKETSGAAAAATEQKSSLFSFGNSSVSSSSSTSHFVDTSQPKFSFGLNSATSATTPTSTFTSSFFSQNSAPKANNSSEGTTAAAAAAAAAAATNDDGEDEPPVLEDANIKEEGSVYDKKCKVFIKKDGTFADHGVGFLFLKLVGEEKKCQVIVRANNKLANVLMNVLLTSSVPVERKGKNNVMICCCPVPDAKPSVVLLRVKTEEDANELAETINKHRK